MSRIISFIYGLVAYAIFFATFLYAIGFVGNLVVPKTINSGTPVPFWLALLVNAGLLGLFAIQHSVMARIGFKKLWSKIVPHSIERSTYVLLASLLLALMFWQWRPMPSLIWDIQQPVAALVLSVLFWAGWGTVLVTTFMINHFDLFGLRQVYLHLRGKPYIPLEFKMAGFYNYVRHPLLMGFMIAFWATPRMTAGHLLFAIATTAYMLIAIQFEEKDLVKFHGEAYVNYRSKVSMIFPFKKKSAQPQKKAVEQKEVI
ncbi:MAG: methanethiol S-methyltransferase [bacterium]